MGKGYRKNFLPRGKKPKEEINPDAYKAVAIRYSTKVLLERCKKNPQESFDEVINKLLDLVEIIDNEPTNTTNKFTN